MLRAFSLAVALTATGQQAASLEVINNSDFEWNSMFAKAADLLCQRSMASQLQSKFEGLELIEINQAPNYWESNAFDGTGFFYPSLKIKSQFGNVNGQMTCIIPKSVNSKVETAVSFDGRGLAGWNENLAVLGRTLEENRVTFSVHASPRN